MMYGIDKKGKYFKIFLIICCFYLEIFIRKKKNVILI